MSHEYEEYQTVKRNIKEYQRKSKQTNPCLTHFSMETLENTILYKRFLNDFLNRCEYLDNSHSESRTIKLTTSEELYLRYKKACEKDSETNIVAFFSFVSEKLTYKTGHATRLAVNIPYSADYGACCKEFDNLRTKTRITYPSLIDFLKRFKEHSGKRSSINIAKEFFYDNEGLVKKIYNVLISASIFTRIEETKNNIERSLSSGRPLSQSTTTHPAYDASKPFNSPSNQFFIERCIEFFRSIDSCNHKAPGTYKNLVMPVLCDETTKTTLLICGEGSLPNKFRPEKCQSIYFFVRRFSYRIEDGAPSLVLTGLNYIKQDISRFPGATTKLRRSNDQYLDLLYNVLLDYRNYVKKDRDLLANRNGIIPPNCPTLFSNFFKSKSEDLDNMLSNKEALRRDMKELETHGGRC